MSVSCSRVYFADSKESLSSWHSLRNSCSTDSRLLASWFTINNWDSLSESFLCAAFKESSVFLCAATSLSNLLDQTKEKGCCNNKSFAEGEVNNGEYELRRSQGFYSLILGNPEVNKLLFSIIT